jgi:hypothetical protein
VAWRERRAGSTLLSDKATPFLIIPNSWRYWAADPHLIEHEGKTYVFAELYDRVLRRGVIGCSQLTAQGATPWQIVLKMPHHLSYPHLITVDETIYMIPESYVANEIAVYRAVDFPYRWEKAAILKEDFCAVDSTVFEANSAVWLLTLRFIDGQERLTLFPIDGCGVLGDGLCVAENDLNKRPAGYFFTTSGKLVRPAQDCTESYGCALNFYEITDVSPSCFEEQLIRKIAPGEIQSNLAGIPAGLHTYNMSEHYEVIDLKEYEFDWLFYVMRPIWFIWRRVRKVFGK